MMHLIGLGHAIITVGATRLTPASETLFAAALLFVSEAGRPFERLRLIELLWPNAEAASGNHCLRQTVYRLNSFGAALRSDRGHIVLPARSAQSDYATVLAGGDPGALSKLIEGPYLQGYTPHFSAPFNAWLEHQRDAVTAGLRRVLVAAIASRRERNDWAGAEQLAARCLLLDPLNEEATLAVAEAAALQGSKRHAIEILDAYLRELGPGAGEIRLPATVLRRRIAETYHHDTDDPRDGPLVGREREVSHVARLLHGLRAQHGDTFLIWGEQGIGKTRLAVELEHIARIDGAKVVRVECQPHDAQRPLSAFADMVPRLRTLRGAIAVAASSNHYLDLLHDHCPHPAPDAPGDLDADALLTNVRRALFDLIDAVANEQALVLILEDVQWLDQRSWDLIRVMAAWVVKRRVLVLLTSQRDELDRCDGWRPGALCLKPLGGAASRALFDGLVRGTPREGHGEFAEWCLAQASGNPYYLAELARHAETDRESFRAPVSLERLVERRLAGLSRTALSVLQAAAILERNATLDALEDLLGGPRFTFLSGFEELGAAGLIAVEDGVTTILHRSIADASAARLSVPAGQLLHRRAAELLERRRATDSSAALLWECADHWQAAGEPRRALELLTTCAQHLIDLGMPADAARMHERAATLADTPAEKAHHLAARAHALFLAATWDQFVRTAAELDALKQRSCPSFTEHDDTELELALARWRLGYDRRELLADGLRCAAAADASSSHRLQAATWALMLADNLCDDAAAAALLRAVSPVLRTADHDDLAATHFEMIYHCGFGDADLGLSAARQLVHTLYERPDSGHKARQLSHAAAALRSCGAPLAEAREAAALALDIAKRLGVAAYAAPAANQMILAYLADNDAPRAREWYERALELAAASDDAAGRSITWSNGAEIALREGRLDDAQRLVDDSQQLVGSVPSSRSEMRYLSFRWRLALARGHASPTEHDVRMLLQLHRRTRRSNGQDSATAVLARLMLLRGRTREAARLLHDYLGLHRRRGVPVDAELEALARQLDVVS